MNPGRAARACWLAASCLGSGCASLPAVPLPQILTGYGKPPPADAKTLAAVKSTRLEWSRIAASPAESREIVAHAGTVLWVELSPQSLPAGGLTSGALRGQRFRAVTAGLQTSDDRRLISPGSILYGEVLDAAPPQDNPFQPARLRLFFYKLEDVEEGRFMPVEAYVVEAPGWETSSGGTILGHADIRLTGNEWIALKLLKPASIHLERNAWGIGITGTQWAGDSLRVTAILPQSSAADAGLAIGDEITEISGKRLEGYNPWALMNGEPGGSVTLKVIKGGQGKPVKVRCRHGVRVFEGVGVRLQDGAEGPRVAGLVPGSPAERAAIEPGSLIIRAGRDDCLGHTASECAALMRRRAGAEMTVVYRPPDALEPKQAVLKAERIVMPLLP